MKDPSRGQSSESFSVWRTLFAVPLPLQKETALFIMVSAFDVFLTYILLYHSALGQLRDPIYESNPVARFFLNHWGVKGVVYFKFSVVAFVAVIAQIIARKRIQTARWLLNAATLLVTCVVIYSVSLLLRDSIPF